MRKRCKTKADHIQFCQDVHGDTYDYTEWLSDTGPFNNKTKIPITCKEHGTFFQILNNHKCGAGCPRCGGNASKTKAEYVEEFEARWGKRFSYDEWTDTQFGAHTKIPITCHIHGSFTQSINGHLRGHGCPSCKTNKAVETNMQRYGVANPQQRHISQSALELLNNPAWIEDQHVTNKRPITDIASELGVWPIAVDARLEQFGIQRYYHQHTTGRSQAERDIEAFIVSLGLTPETSNRTLIRPHELDIVIHSHKIAIEYCGLYWHSTANDRMTPQYHKQKMDKCAVAGYRLITIFEDEWLSNSNIVKKKLASILGVCTDRSVAARKCTVERINITDRKSFFNANHIQGDGPGSLCYGLKHGDEMVAAMTFIQSGTTWILNRYATSRVVPGGFTKLLSQFERQHEWSEVVSFADLRWSVGGVYERCGFVLDRILKPDYYYVVGNTRVHKFNFRHKHLQRLLGDKYDPNLSETQNTTAAGIYRIYNCGLMRFVKTK